MMKTFSLVGLGVLLVSLFGCREVHHYGYKYYEQQMLGGVFSIDVVGRYGENYEEGERKFLDWGFPYNIHFGFRFADGEISRLEIINIQLIGVDDNKKYTLGDVGTNRVRDYSGKKLLRVAVGPLIKENYQYQDYLLKATIVFHGSSGIEKLDLSVVLEKEFRTESRSDWFDESTSI
ncbi:hypothetical protein G8764_16825 [Pseudomaricurvus alcaniphilus]|uniref:hypothetical protein n=1 Tax=Pseudomaricurvus alcaniphilus TaxID=1166482 RepID=UPI00140E2BF9|nr:hypothetical protein [Pseudomaricurvus alcaniphilus]NHN38975.1 hypothetical protein [Pseudomaricurvus alcaniphilus]